MNNTFIFILLLIFALAFVACCLNYFSTNLTNSNNEPFAKDYYWWNWNDPDLINNINYSKLHPKCKNCTYSVSCDLTDDALPNCCNSYDIHKYDPRHNIMVTNSY